MASGKAVAAVAIVAMTETGAGSDLKSITNRSVRDGGDDLTNGQKTYISTVDYAREREAFGHVAYQVARPGSQKTWIDEVACGRGHKRITAEGLMR